MDYITREFEALLNTPATCVIWWYNPDTKWACDIALAALLALAED